MAPRKEVLDSDDEDEDFSPVKNLLAPPGPDEGKGPEDDSPDPSRNRRAESTDPSFFRNVYEKQHVAADAQQATSGVAALRSELVSTSSLNPPLDLSHAKEQDDPSNLSSITDPAPPSRRKQKMSVTKEVVDLTQVTTPGRPTPGVPADIWEFPASAEGDAAAASSSITQPATAKKNVTIKLKKAETKRNSILSSTTQSAEATPSSDTLPKLPVPPAERHPSEPPKKRRRTSGTGEQAVDSQEVDLLVIPRSIDKASSDHHHVDLLDTSVSIVENSLKARTKSLLVVPSTTMTPSQKDEYRFVSLSSEVDHGHERPGLPMIVGQTEDSHKSSGSATIKYPTPTEYASSGRRAPHPGEYGTAASSRPRRKRNAAVDSDARSSPDIISAPSVTRREKRATNGSDPTEEDSWMAMASVSPPKVINGGGVLSEPEELWMPGSTAGKAERDAGDDHLLPEHGNVARDSIPAANDVSQKKTRGRKSRELPSTTLTEESLPNTAWPGAEEQHSGHRVEQRDLPPEPAPKKRRGRPRKEPQGQAVVIDDNDGETVQQDAQEVSIHPDGENETPKPKKKRGRPRKADATTSIEEATPDQTAGVLQHDEDEAHDTAHVTSGRATSGDASVRTSRADESPRALMERDNNSNSGPSPAKRAATAQDAVDGTSKEDQVAEVEAKRELVKEVKPAIPSSQGGKVQYRVGLSRKTRIAPLLKSFRK